MKKRIIFVLIAVLAVSFSSTSHAGLKDLKKKIKESTTKKDDKKKDKKAKKEKNKTAPAAVNVVLLKGLQISKCGEDVKDNGSVTIQGLSNADIPVINGKFDLILPNAPVFDSEWESGQRSGGGEMDFGTAKVQTFPVLFFNNSSKNEDAPGGRGFFPFQILYSDSDVNGTVNGETVTLKKGWNIVGDKNETNVGLMCAG